MTTTSYCTERNRLWDETQRDNDPHARIWSTSIEEQESILQTIQTAGYADHFLDGADDTFPPAKQQYLCTPIPEEEEWTEEESIDSRPEGYPGLFPDQEDQFDDDDDEDDDTIVREQRRLLEFYSNQKKSTDQIIKTCCLPPQEFESSACVSDQDVLLEQQRLLEEIAAANRLRNNGNQQEEEKKKCGKRRSKEHSHKSKKTATDLQDSTAPHPKRSTRKIRVQGYEKAAEAISLGRAVLRCCPHCRIVLQVDESCRHLYCTNCEQVSHVSAAVTGREIRQALHHQEANLRSKIQRN